MQKLLKYGSLLVLSVSLCVSTAIAKTPDGKTPSEETICDVFKGGAFGLCNAYCEALDCGDPNQRASESACTRVNDNFEKRYGMRLPDAIDYDESGDVVDNCIVEPDEPPIEL